MSLEFHTQGCCVASYPLSKVHQDTHACCAHCYHSKHSPRGKAAAADVCCAWWQVVSTECEISSFELQPTFSECLEYAEGDPSEDSRQSKKQKVLSLPLPAPHVQSCQNVKW